MKLYRVLPLMLILALAFLPHSASAQQEEASGVRIQLGGSVTISGDEVVGFLWAADATTRIEGRVDGSVLLMSGNTQVNGVVDGDIIVFGGTLTLGEAAVVTGDLIYNETTVVTDPGAVVQGSVRDDLGVEFSQDFTRLMAWFALANWAGTTFLALLAGVVFAGIGGRQLWSSAATITAKPLQSIFMIVAVSIVMTLLAGLLFVSVIGIPVGIVLLIALAVIWALGYIVAGTRIGAALTRRSLDNANETHPYMPVLTGITVIQIIALIPVVITLVLAYAAIDDATRISPINAFALVVYWSISALIWLIGLLGAGALCYRAWRAWANPRPAEPLA